MSDFSKILAVAPALQKRWNHQERLKLQNAVRKILPTHRSAACLRHRLGGSAVAVSVTAKGHTRLGGLMVCDAHHVCPVCHDQKMAKDKVAISEQVHRHYVEGGFLVDAVLTVPHHSSEPLRLVLDRLDSVWKELRGKPLWRKISTDLGVVGIIRRLEITLGVNGWHPHFHISLLCDWGEALELRGATRNAVHMDAFAIVCAAWAAAGAKKGLPISMHAQSAVAIVAAVDAQKAVAYNLKNMGYGEKEDGLTPFDLLRIVSQNDTKLAHAAARRLFAEYANAVKGKHVISLTGKARIKHDPVVKKDLLESTILGRIAPAAWVEVLRFGLREAVTRVQCFAALFDVLQMVAKAAGHYELPPGWLHSVGAVVEDS